MLGPVAVLAVLAGLAAAPPAADHAEAARACAANLSPEGQAMYAAVAPAIRPKSNIAETMRSKVRIMVMDGQVSRGDAQANGAAVAGCLALLQ